jgi:hypothetical protein
VVVAHSKCRAVFCAQFYLKIAGISPNLHCCWSIATVLQSLGLDPGAAMLAARCVVVLEIGGLPSVLK